VTSPARRDDRPESALTANIREMCRPGGLLAPCHLEWISQRGGKGSGTSEGAPDLILHRRGVTHIVECKRPDGGRLSRAQIIAARLRWEDGGVPTYVVASEQEFADLCCGRLAPWRDWE